MEKKLLPFVLFLSFNWIISMGQATPNNPNATKSTREVFDFLWDLSYGTTPGVIVGQNCNHGNEITDYAYNKYVELLAVQTGKYVGMVGVDYEFMKIYSINELKSANKTLIDFWDAGGLITINYSPLNILDNNSGAMSRGGGGDMYRILPGGDLRKNWLARLDVIAEALRDLQNNGVTVLWRPMQEENGPLFWYATASFADGGQSREDFISLYQDMFDYFTYSKGLNNLLWVFAPTGSASWSPFPYPGDKYVDVVSGTTYNSSLNVNQNEFNIYKKPNGVSEYGWDTNNTIKRDNMIYQIKLAQNPQIAYWMSWHDWSNIKMSIIANNNASALMNHEDILTRDELPDFRMIDSLPPSTPNGLYATKITNLSFRLNWALANDDFGVAKYLVYKNGALYDSTAENHIDISGLSPSTSYEFTLLAKDAKGFISDFSDTLTVVTEAFEDAIPPSVPTELQAIDITTRTFKLNWKIAEDNIEVVSYKLIKNGLSSGIYYTNSAKVVNLEPSTSYAMAVIAIDKAGNESDTSLVLNVTTVEVPADNLAYNKPVEVSSTTGTYSSAYAVDGDLSTRWESAWTNNEWIYVDLGGFYDVNRLILTWEYAYASGYNIQISNDATTWTGIFTTSNGNGATDDITVSGTGRFVRVLMTKRGTGYGNSLWELEVYGTPHEGNVSAGQSNIAGNLMTIYPNPVQNERLNISLNKFHSGAITIWNINGNMVHQERILNPSLNNIKFSLNVSGYSRGLYIINVTTDQFAVSQKFVID